MSEKTLKTICIKWVRSGIGFTHHQKTIVRSLGLNKLNHTVVRLDTPQIRGIVAAVPHLLEIVPEPVAPAWAWIPEYSVHAPVVRHLPPPPNRRLRRPRPRKLNPLRLVRRMSLRRREASRRRRARNRLKTYGDTHWNTSTTSGGQQALQANRAGNGVRTREDRYARRQRPALQGGHAYAAGL